MLIKDSETINTVSQSGSSAYERFLDKRASITEEKQRFPLPYAVMLGLVFWMGSLAVMAPEVSADERVPVNRFAGSPVSVGSVNVSSVNVPSVNVPSEPTEQGFIIRDSEKQVYFERPPKRIAVLNWDLAEQLIELEVMPVAMPEIEAYHEWVVRPRVSGEVEELGLRDEPNLERLAAVKPDLILIAHRHKGLQQRLMKIAPVLYFDTFSQDHNNAQASIEIFRTLAKLVQKSSLAEAKLQQMDVRIAQLRQQLLNAYRGDLPAVTTIRFSSLTSVYIYGDNSMPQYALEMLGIPPAMPQPVTQWGITQTRLLDLRSIHEGIVLYFTPFDQEKKLKKSAIWQAMPFVQAGQSHRVRPAWTYGGAMSLRYMAEALTESLLEIAPVPVPVPVPEPEPEPLSVQTAIRSED